MTNKPSINSAMVPSPDHGLIKPNGTNSLVQRGLSALEKAKLVLPQSTISAEAHPIVRIIRTTIIDGTVNEVIHYTCADLAEAKSLLRQQIMSYSVEGYELEMVTHMEYISFLHIPEIDYQEDIHLRIERGNNSSISKEGMEPTAPRSNAPGMERADSGCTGYYKTEGVYSFPKIAWQFFLGNKPQEPIVYNGMVYATTARNTVALDLTSGRETWELPIGSHAATAVSEGIVVVHGYPGFKDLTVATSNVDWLYGLDALTGEELWCLGESFPYCAASPTILGNSLVVWDDTFFSEIDLKQGRILQSPDIIDEFSPLFPSKPAIDANRIYYIDDVDGTKVIAIDTSTRQKKWEISVSPFDSFMCNIIAVDGLVVVSINNVALARSGLDGSEQWICIMDGHINPPAVGMGKAFLLSKGYSNKALCLVAIDVHTGENDWTYNTEANVSVCVGPSLAEDCVYFCGDLYLYALSTSGHLLWDFLLPSLPIHPPVIADGHVLICCEDGHLYVILREPPEKVQKK